MTIEQYNKQESCEGHRVPEHARAQNVADMDASSRFSSSGRFNFGLSAKLLLLTIGFVMLAEILIFVPSVSNFRKNWLNERLEAAQIASLALEASPAGAVPDKLRRELLKKTGVHAVALRRIDARRLLLQSDMPSKIDAHFDLRKAPWYELITDAMMVLFRTKGRMVRIIGEPGFSNGEFIEIVVDEQPLRAAMLQFGLNIFLLSVFISLISATLVYLALNALLVRPIRAMTRNVVRFRENPEDPGRIIQPSQRTDEIGIAEHALAEMQTELAGTIQQKNHLAALGLAVSKISHDLRNILANAQLVSDRLGMVEDVTVQRITPKLLGSLDRAIRLCTDTLRYGQAQEKPPQLSVFKLKPLVEEVGEGLGLSTNGKMNGSNVPINWRIEIEKNLDIKADKDQLYRVLTNLTRNSYQVLESVIEKAGEGANGFDHEVCIDAMRDQGGVVITVRDTGPGLPEKARKHLFEAFQGSSRKGGTGLGLAISAELIRAHGGDIKYVNMPKGAVFEIILPDLDQKM